MRDFCGHKGQGSIMAQKSIGTSEERKTYAGNYGQTFFDTTLNKMVMYNGTKWVDMNGAEVDI